MIHMVHQIKVLGPCYLHEHGSSDRWHLLKEHMISIEKVMNIKVVELINLSLLFWSSFHVTKFEQFKF
jgi:hypothetical protein